MPFAHLHVHSQYSLLNGVPTPKELVAAAKSAGMANLALTDTCNLYGAVDFYKGCKDKGIHPVFGAEIWVDPRGMHVREGGLEQAYQLVLLVEGQQGYENLCKLVTAAIFDGIYHRPRIDLAMLRTHNEGLIALTSAELGPIRGGRRGQDNGERLVPLVEIFGVERLYAELADPGIDGVEERLGEVRLWAEKLGLSTVVTNDIRYVEPSDAVLLDVLNCIASGTSLNDAKRDRPRTDQLYFKTEAQMRALFPDDGAALDRTVAIAERCTFKFNTSTYYFPSSTPPDAEPTADSDRNWAFFYEAFPPPRDYGMPAETPERPIGSGSLNGYFFWYARRGLELRLKLIAPELHPAYLERLEDELRLILKMGFAAYLLIVAEFINWAKDRDIPVGPGRGSAAGSVVTWAMRITDIDPVRYVLLFERFLNPERISMPDIDVDFAQDRREEVIEHVRAKYGTDVVAQIITYGKLQTKAALKDVARVCDLSFTESDRITKLIPNKLNISIDDSLKEEPRLVELCRIDPRVRRVVELARGIEGITRQTGVHAAGVVVADRPLVTLTPLYRDGPEGGPVVQYDMKSAESIGLIKFDFLGLKTLDQIRDAVAMVQRNTGERIDIGNISVEDEKTYQLLQRGDGLGVFQVESSGMRELLTRLRPSCIDDLVALVALYRPGPLSSGMVDDFIDRKHGRKEVTYPFIELATILGSTYGTIVYQEQVMQVAQVLAGYSLGEADLLRRAMGKKNPEEMAKQKGRFVSGSVKNNHDEKKASDLFDLLAKFAEYGFNKSHSAAYGYIAYQTAWLKAHHRAEYMAALMSIDAGDSDKILIYLGDCKRAGLTILPPDVQTSVRYFDVPATDRRSIRYGLAALKGLGENAIAAIVEAREAAGGAFKDYFDLLCKLDWKRLNKKALESLIKSGALDTLREPRARMWAAAEEAMQAAQGVQEAARSPQMGLFGGKALPPAFKLPAVGEWPISERMTNEKEALGLFLTGHPVQAFAEEAKRWATPIPELNKLPIAEPGPRRREDSQVPDARICGVVAAFRVIKTKKGDKMAFATIEDEQAAVEAVFFAKALAASQSVLEAGKPLLVTGKLEKKGDAIVMLAETAELMEDLRERRTRAVEIHVRAEELEGDAYGKLVELLAGNLGACETAIILEEAGKYAATIRVGEDHRVRATPKLVEGLRGLFGRAEVVRLG